MQINILSSSIERIHSGILESDKNRVCVVLLEYKDIWVKFWRMNGVGKENEEGEKVSHSDSISSPISFYVCLCVAHFYVFC